MQSVDRSQVSSSYLEGGIKGMTAKQYIQVLDALKSSRRIRKGVGPVQSDHRLLARFDRIATPAQLRQYMAEVGS